MDDEEYESKRRAIIDRYRRKEILSGEAIFLTSQLNDEFMRERRREKKNRKEGKR